MRKYRDSVCVHQGDSPVWVRLKAARDASAVWYGVEKIPPIKDWVRVPLEYAILILAFIADAYTFRLATQYLRVGPTIPAWMVSLGDDLQLSTLVVFTPYFAILWVTATFPDNVLVRHICQKASSQTVAHEAAQTALRALGGWDALGVEFLSICGVKAREAPWYNKAFGAWAIGTFGSWVGHVLFGKTLSRGGLLLAVALLFTYTLFQFVSVAHTRKQARHPEKYSPCKFKPLFMLLDSLRATVEDKKSVTHTHSR